jgi:hypothetical protein
MHESYSLFIRNVRYIIDYKLTLFTAVHCCCDVRYVNVEWEKGHSLGSLEAEE